MNTVGRNNKAIEKNTRSQLKEDKECEQLTMIELFDLFTGEPLKKARRSPNRAVGKRRHSK